MIRAARFADIPRLTDLLCEMHDHSKYAGVVEVSRPAAQGLLQNAIRRHDGEHDGGALVMVDEQAGEIEGFIVGVLNRVYLIGDKLAANDLFLHTTGKAGGLSALKLLAAYVAWADRNPKVHEIKLSWTDTMPGAERIGMVYERMGFARCGAIYERGRS
jgi:hypothetical protein